MQHDATPYPLGGPGGNDTNDRPLCLLATRYGCTEPATVEEHDPRYPDDEPYRWCHEHGLASAGDALRNGRAVTLRPVQVRTPVRTSAGAEGAKSVPPGTDLDGQSRTQVRQVGSAAAEIGTPVPTSVPTSEGAADVAIRRSTSDSAGAAGEIGTPAISQEPATSDREGTDFDRADTTGGAR